MAHVKNILFIMCDQLRWDYLSCYGHPHLHTPHIDGLAERGLRFTQAYAQAPVCGPSRMCFYTGRTVASHGSSYNGYPLPLSQMTLGDYLRPLGLQTVLVGKTHMAADTETLTRLGLDPDSDAAIHAREGGFTPFERDDGLHPSARLKPHLRYNTYLQEKGYSGQNPWHDHANSALSADGTRLSGWAMRHAHLPADINEADSETPYMTGRAIDFIEQAGDAPWCLHLSYIKPHWPYMAPAPYHQLYGPDHCLPPQRHPSEPENAHPVLAAFMNRRVSHAFARDEVRQRVIPTYMGLVKQIDDQIGRLMRFLTAGGYLENTLIVFTSDHGDYLGDHWLGEKDYFHDTVTRIPLIIYDPDPTANARRGQVEDSLVAAIDLVPSFIDALGGDMPRHRLEGRSLLPLLRNESPPAWRDCVVSEMDYGSLPLRHDLNLSPDQSRMTMLRTETWKYILHEHEALPPQLYHLPDDPNEYHDLGRDPAFAQVRAALHERLFTWFRQRQRHITTPHARIAHESTPGVTEASGILIGYW